MKITKITIALLALYSLNSFADISDAQIQNTEQVLSNPFQHNEEEQKRVQGFSRFNAQENFRLLKVLRKSHLVLPPSFLAHPEAGQVLLWVSVNEHGDVTSVDIHNSSGNYDLDMAAEAAVRHYKYQPYLDPKTGEAIAAKDKLIISYPESQETVNSAAVSASPAPQSKNFLTAAQSGDPMAENSVGMSYFLGNGVTQDFTQARVWFEKAASQNLPAAEVNLGSLYLLGKGVAVDYAQALNWFQKAANQNNPTAENDLANMFHMGQGVVKDDMQASVWLKKAASQGFAESEAGLGISYLLGRGVPQDYGLARMWLQKAADQNFAPAENALGLMYHQGQGVPKNDLQALVWLQKAADQKFAPAIDNVKKLSHQYHSALLGDVIAE